MQEDNFVKIFRELQMILDCIFLNKSEKSIKIYFLKNLIVFKPIEISVLKTILKAPLPHFSFSKLKKEIGTPEP